MAITFSCECGKRLKTPDDWGGRWVRCTACKRELLVPLPAVGRTSASTPSLSAMPRRPPRRRRCSPSCTPMTSAARGRVIAATPTGIGAARTLLARLRVLAAAAGDASRWRSIRSSSDPDTLSRLRETICKPTRSCPKQYGALDDDELEHDRRGGVLLRPARQPHPGALHGKYTLAHWGYAAASAVVFLGFVIVALPGMPGRAVAPGAGGAVHRDARRADADDHPALRHVLLLLPRRDVPRRPRPRRAVRPSLLGHFLGVGLCEEVIKSPPRPLVHLTARPLRLARPASGAWPRGAGFGVSEAIFYATNYYNGLEGALDLRHPLPLLPAFHLLLSGSAGILLQRNQHHLEARRTTSTGASRIVAIISVPMLLHGLFNTLGKKGFEATQVGAVGGELPVAGVPDPARRERQSGLLEAANAGPMVVRTAQGTRIVQR